ncbi:Wall-associated kinase family protein [Rhynchospora pubera]|uniref:Wall-associated kinase family protein n=1 Tax=Rhynchospora pubera TaxID=906938 RepID=A0AAV8E8Q1_9POAL|nr:Wall-associated kinase family protein [Rhynchospora pubera]
MKIKNIAAAIDEAIEDQVRGCATFCSSPNDYVKGRMGLGCCHSALPAPDPYLYNIPGYYCNCSQGFQGNPYIVGGCTDIDQCQYPEMNPCVGRCINEIGNVSCACPRGMVGDGKKDGTGCRRVFPLALTLGVGLGSIFILTTATFWWYMSFQKRKLIKMRAKFFRQNGGYLLKQRYDLKGIDSTRKIFTTEQLQKATDNYNENRVLGRGGFDEKYTAKISDFGASRPAPFDQTHVTTVVQGTFGYLDPEYFTTHHLTEKSDIYSFGVVLAELWLREKPISYERAVEIQGLAAYFNRLASSGSLMQVIDPCIVEEAGVERIEAVGRLTDKCLCLKRGERPTMREVATELERILRAIEPDLMNPNSDAIVPLLSGPKVVGQSRNQHATFHGTAKMIPLRNFSIHCAAT